MTSIDISRNSEAQIKRTIKICWNCFVTMLSIVLICRGFCYLFQFKEPSDTERYIRWGAVIAGTIYAVLTIGITMAASENRDYSTKALPHLDWIGERFKLLPPVVWFVVLALFSVAGTDGVKIIPHRVGVPAHMIRLLDDGRVISAGETVEVPRYQATSVLVSLDQNEVPLQFAVTTKAGAFTVSALVDLHFSDNAVATLLKGHSPAELGEGMDDEERLDQQKKFFSQLANSYAIPAAREIVFETLAGMSSDPDARLVRFTQLLVIHPEYRPTWASHITVRHVSIEKGDTLTS